MLGVFCLWFELVVVGWFVRIESSGSFIGKSFLFSCSFIFIFIFCSQTREELHLRMGFGWRLSSSLDRFCLPQVVILLDDIKLHNLF